MRKRSKGLGAQHCFQARVLYESIRNGMRVEDLNDLLGSPGEYVPLPADTSKPICAYRWKIGLSSICTVFFYDGKSFGKTARLDD